jgi:hypothetical protein
MTAPEPEPTRAQRVQADSGHLDFPPLTAEQGLIRVLFEVGPVMPSGMGAMPITEQELTAWQHNSGHRLTPWQAATVRRLSREYAAEQRRAEDPGAPAPWQQEPTAWNRDAVSRQVSNAFKALTMAKGRT